MCGNFNRLREDDFHKPDGTNAQDATALAKSWQTGQSTSSCETILVPHQCDPLEEAKYASELYCGRLLSSTGPFADCQSVLGAESYFRGCVVSMCSSHGDPAVLCETLRVYTDVCNEAGVALPTWRNSTFCRMLFLQLLPCFISLPPDIKRGETAAYKDSNNTVALRSFSVLFPLFIVSSQPFSVLRTATITHVLMAVPRCAPVWIWVALVETVRNDASVTQASNSVGESVSQLRIVGAGIMGNTMW